jgi:NADH:ubiquinone oxidoreductase subunit 2 (subunit N)
MLHAHSGFRWIALILIILTIYKAFKGIKNAEEYTAKHKMLALGTLITFHTMVLVGFSLLFSSTKTAFFDMTQPFRFYTIEHPLMMTIAVILVTMGYSKAKKEESSRMKFRKILIFYTVALLITLVAIPWPFRGLGGGWM